MWTPSHTLLIVFILIEQVPTLAYVWRHLLLIHHHLKFSMSKTTFLINTPSSDPLLLIAPVRSFRFIPDSSFICTTSNWPLNPVGPTFTTYPGPNHFSSLTLNPLPLQHLVCCLACKQYRINNHWMNKGMNARQNILEKKLISLLCGLIFLCHYPIKNCQFILIF